MKRMKDKIYYFVTKIPDILFTLIQIVFVVRFLFKIVDIPDIPPATTILYQITDILSFPLGMILQHYIPVNSQIYETLLIGSCLIYLIAYLLILDGLKIIFREAEDE